VSFRDVWPGIFQINGLILVDIGNKLFALVVKGLKKLWFLAVSTIHSDGRCAHFL
jgi:hypothetical protein